MYKAVILVANGFQDEEYVYPYYRMLEEGWRVDVASISGLDVFGKYGVPARVNRSAEQLSPEDYDLVFIPGGFESPDRLRADKAVCQFVEAMYDDGRLVAAICHGPWVCITAGIMHGRNATGYKSIRADIINAGALYLDQPVVCDGNLITGRHYKDNPDFMREVIVYMRSVHSPRAYASLGAIV